MHQPVLCIGEILWDTMPRGLFLGGAPFNVARHLKTLGEEVAFASRVGDDQLGREAIRRVRFHGIATDYIQIDPTLKTGFVEVELAVDGVPGYVIHHPVAWDAIEWYDDLLQLSANAKAVVFGTLAQRSAASRETIKKVVNGSDESFKVVDLNLRPPFDDPQVIRLSLELADGVKMNDEELLHLKRIFALEGGDDQVVEELAQRFGLEMICVTRGAEGAMLWLRGEWATVPGIRVEVADTVGSGDAFLAALLKGYLQNLPADEMLIRANQLGAFVATQPGGTPDYSITSLDGIPALL